MLTRWMRFTRFSSPSETNGCRRVLPERHSETPSAPFDSPSALRQAQGPQAQGKARVQVQGSGLAAGLGVRNLEIVTCNANQGKTTSSERTRDSYSVDERRSCLWILTKIA